MMEGWKVGLMDWGINGLLVERTFAGAGMKDVGVSKAFVIIPFKLG
jgi:hypothetical protein